jgi:hypothetical protein
MTRETPRRRGLWPVLAIATLALAGTAYAAAPDGGDAARAQQTIRLVEASAVPQLSLVDVGTPGPSAGDQVVLHDGLNRPDGSAAGSFQQACTTIVPGPSPVAGAFECTGSITLAEGTLIIAGPFSATAPVQSQAITGGTGAFRAARGEVTIRAEDDTLTVRLAR